MKAEVPNHEPSLMLMNCGDQQNPRPSLGAWVTYGLGSENRDLPGFCVMVQKDSLVNGGREVETDLFAGLR